LEKQLASSSLATAKLAEKQLVVEPNYC